MTFNALKNRSKEVFMCSMFSRPVCTHTYVILNTLKTTIWGKRNPSTVLYT